MHSAKIAVFLLSFLTSAWSGDPCPSKEDIASCSCNHRPDADDVTAARKHYNHTSVTPRSDLSASADEHLTPEFTPSSPNKESSYTVVQCKGTRTLSALEEAVQIGLYRKQVDSLVVSFVPPERDHVLARLPYRWLQYTRVKKFEIRDSVMSGDFIWYGAPFDGQNDALLWFTAVRCSLYGALTLEDAGTTNTKGLRELSRLEGIDFSSNHLTTIRATAFRVPPANLSNLIFSRNSLQTIETTSFLYIPFLRIVDLSHNLLETLIRGVFAAPARYLESIDMSWNFLKTLPVDFFVNMPALKQVNLSKNFLYTLPDKPWGYVWKQLVFIDITGNFLDCDCNLLWLLPIVSPGEANPTSSPTSLLPSGQTVKGFCSETRRPGLLTVQHEIRSLTREKIMCR